MGSSHNRALYKCSITYSHAAGTGFAEARQIELDGNIDSIRLPDRFESINSSSTLSL